MCSRTAPTMKWKLFYICILFILWSYAIFLSIIDIRETWQRGYGRIYNMVGFSILPPSVPALPLLFLPGLLCTKRHIFTVTVSLIFLAMTTFCICLSMTIIQEVSLGGLEQKLTEDLHNKYGHGVSNKISNLVFTQNMDYAQYTFQCCGIKNDKDYLQSNWYNEESGKNKVVPPSCCIPETYGTISNISHSGTPINVVLRVFYGMLEEGWQHPQPKSERSCQSLNATIKNSARNVQGCLRAIEEWVRMENVKAIFLDGILLIFEVLIIIFSMVMPHNIDNPRNKTRNKNRKRNKNRNKNDRTKSADEEL